MSSPTYKSSVLSEHAPHKGNCPACRMLAGATDSDTLLAVISLLDSRLADEEEESRADFQYRQTGSA